MKAEEAKIRSMETRSRLVTEQLKTVHRSINIAVKEGRFSVRLLDTYPSARNVGWLEEVVKKLKDEGYTVNLVQDCLFVEWEDVKEVKKSPNPPKDRKIVEREIPPRPHKDPHMIKEDGAVGSMFIAALILSVLFVLVLRWMLV